MNVREASLGVGQDLDVACVNGFEQVCAVQARDALTQPLVVKGLSLIKDKIAPDKAIAISPVPSKLDSSDSIRRSEFRAPAKLARGVDVRDCRELKDAGSLGDAALS